MFAVCIIGYFSLKVINYGVIQFIGDPALSVRYGAVMQVLEFLLLGAVMVIFRTQPLPPFYGIGLNEINVSVSQAIFICIDWICWQLRREWLEKASVFCPTSLDNNYKENL
jgi:hypothetical protein